MRRRHPRSLRCRLGGVQSFRGARRSRRRGHSSSSQCPGRVRRSSGARRPRSPGRRRLRCSRRVRCSRGACRLSLGLGRGHRGLSCSHSLGRRCGTGLRCSPSVRRCCCGARGSRSLGRSSSSCLGRRHLRHSRSVRCSRSTRCSRSILCTHGLGRCCRARCPRCIRRSCGALRSGACRVASGSSPVACSSPIPGFHAGLERSQQLALLRRQGVHDRKLVQHLEGPLLVGRPAGAPRHDDVPQGLLGRGPQLGVAQGLVDGTLGLGHQVGVLEDLARQRLGLVHHGVHLQRRHDEVAKAHGHVLAHDELVGPLRGSVSRGLEADCIHEKATHLLLDR
mmetsp:Transcript_71947/g.224342  ORF Transcript_71947/g.224342 Transcript_71947/m.224342 type:complete len:337 (-) Transcript_71947:696-1706(-)